MGCTAQVAGGVPAMCDGVTQAKLEKFMMVLLLWIGWSRSKKEG
jgi:hypothetical protein